MNLVYEQINAAAGYILPEIFLLVSACLMFLAGPFLVSEAGQTGPGLRHRWGTLSLLTLGAAGLVWYQTGITAPVEGPFRTDAFTWFVRGVILGIGPILVLLLWNQAEDGVAAEAHACLLVLLAGVNFVALANDLVLIFLGLELVSIPTYILLYLPRRNRLTYESTVKYFLLSIFSSALMLYGLAWVFGLAGTTNLPAIAAAAKGGALASSSLFPIALVLLLAGLGFRITSVPFHFYAPDVFQGTTSSIAAMLSFIPKAVGFAALLRLLPMLNAATLADWSADGRLQTTLAAIAIATMIGGNLLALRQVHLHRLLAYSSVAHAGYMLVGLTVGDGGSVNGLSALLFYLVIYGIMTIGVFAVIAALGGKTNPVQTLSDLSGLSRTQPVAALMMAICLFGLAGLPPTVGFLGKLNLFLAGWSEGTQVGQVLAIVLGLNAVIAAWYYLRIIAVMYLEAPQRTEATTGEAPAWVAAALCSLATLIAFVTPQWLWTAAERALAAG